MLSLIIISGRSGSGKSTSLNVLEDSGYFCIDNLPVTLLTPLIKKLNEDDKIEKAAVSIDARNIPKDLALFPSFWNKFNKSNVSPLIIFLDSTSETLVKRFSETRRKHPLSNKERDLKEALDLESSLLDPISELAALTIDTTNLTVHDLRNSIKTRVGGGNHSFALSFQSFAYKRGVPLDADLVFDVRCLPNPHWEAHLRELSGLDREVEVYLKRQPIFNEMCKDISKYLDRWIPRFLDVSRSYLTVAIGCTGGQHRSVLVSRVLYENYQKRYDNVQLRHRELFTND
ncbi:MAG: RNase adapter RapZ [Pseudomonadota bacterium]|nr:RNase adapter RapZ [Pseudomonadota bacterium]